MRWTVHPDKAAAGAAAAADGALAIRAALDARGAANIVLATGASQFEMLDALVREPQIDWHRVTAFHLDEYVGLPVTHRASFRLYLWQRFVTRLPLPLRTMTPLAGPFFNSAAQGAWPTLQAATGANVQGGDYLGPQGLGEVSGRSGPARATRTARDPKLARELWMRSIELTGVDPGL